MGYSDNIRQPITSREKLAQLMPSVMAHVEFAPGMSMAQWLAQCNHALACTPDARMHNIEGMQLAVQSVHAGVQRIAEQLLIQPDRVIQPDTVCGLAASILQCSLASEMLRPAMGERWPAAPGAGTNGDSMLAQQMIEQIRKEVKNYYAMRQIQRGGRER